MALTTKEQDAILKSCITNIKHQSNLMQNDLNENKLLPALKHCSNLLNELRVNQLTPKQYYEMYMMVFDSLEILSEYLISSYNARLKRRIRGDTGSDAKANNDGNERNNSGGNSSSSSNSSSNSATSNDNGQFLGKGKSKANHSSTTASVATSAFLADLYEIVQYSGNIIPRLYMMIVIGTTYMSTGGAPSKDLMKDMVEMCHGVQHPIRGLFLRYYLSQRTKNLLPYETRVDFNETVNFLITNFIEMNKLWVRLQHQGHSSERELRYRERKEIKILVGSNLVRLSEVLDDYKGSSIDENYSSVEFYKNTVFPAITEQIIQCKDHLAQTYLIDVIIQVFPDEYHFATLETMLNQVFLSLHPLLDKSELVHTLIEKFTTYHKFNDNVSSLSIAGSKGDSHSDDHISVEGEVLFKRFWSFYLKLNEVDPDLPPEEHTKLLQSIIDLSLSFNPNNLSVLDTVYEFAAQKLTTTEPNEEQREMLLQLLLVSINHFTTIKTIFTFKNFYQFYEKINDENTKRQISLAIIDKILQVHNGYEDVNDENDYYYTTTSEIDGIFKYVTVLSKQNTGKLDTAKDLGITETIKINNETKLITPEYLETQEKVCKLIQLVNDPQDAQKSVLNLLYLRKKYLSGNFESIVYTYPTVITKVLFKLKLLGYAKLKLGSRSKDKKESLQRFLVSNFKNLSVILDELYQVHHENHSTLILNLYLQLASVADQIKLQSLTFELFNQCFVVYEENLLLSSHQYKPFNEITPYDSLANGSVAYRSISSIANALFRVRNMSRENYEILITKVTLYGSKLSKKQDQCRAIFSCANLWWWTEQLLPSTDTSPIVNENREETENTEIEKHKNISQGNSKDNKTSNENVHGKDVDRDNEGTEDVTEKLYRDQKRVLECLQRALKIADSSMDPFLSLNLFIEILNRCLVFNLYGNTSVDNRYINGVISLIRTNIDDLKGDTDIDAYANETSDFGIQNNANSTNDKETKILSEIQKQFKATLQYIREQQESENRFPGVFA